MRAEELIALCEKNKYPQWLGGGLVMSGVARTARGSTEQGLRLVDVGLKAHRTAGHAGISLMLLAFAAEAHLRVGNDARALDLLAEAIAVSEKSSVGWYRPEVLRLQSEVLLQSKQIAAPDAIARVEHAAWLAKSQGAVALEWRAVTALARLLAQEGRAEQARDRLRSVCGESNSGLDSADLEGAKSLLSTLS